MRHCNSQCQIQFSFIILCEIHKLEEHPYLISAELSNCTKSGMIERSACPMPGKGSTLNKVHKACAHITFTLLTFASCDIWTVFLTTCFFLDFQILFQEGNIAQDQPRNICSLSNLILGISTFFLLNFSVTWLPAIGFYCPFHHGALQICIFFWAIACCIPATCGRVIAAKDSHAF